MSELKTKPSDADVDAFLAAIPDADRRADAQAVAALFREVTGHAPQLWGKAMVGYGTYTYRDSKGTVHEWFPLGFAPRKKELTLYLATGHQPHAELMARLGKVRTGVSCIYVRRLSDVDQAVLREVIVAAAAAPPAVDDRAARD